MNTIRVKFKKKRLTFCVCKNLIMDVILLRLLLDANVIHNFSTHVDTFNYKGKLICWFKKIKSIFYIFFQINLSVSLKCLCTHTLSTNSIVSYITYQDNITHPSTLIEVMKIAD